MGYPADENGLYSVDALCFKPRECRRLKCCEPNERTLGVSEGLWTKCLNHARGGRTIAYVVVPLCAFPDLRTMCGEDSDHSTNSWTVGPETRPDC